METVPEITVQALAAKLKSGAKFTLLDVREAWELNLAQIVDGRLLALPLSQIARERKNAFPVELHDPQAEIVIMCHHGVRSADVTAWMRQQGWQNVYSLAGGIADYADQIDPAVGQY
jgi:rhodanese-related sulfurtransferase